MKLEEIIKNRRILFFLTILNLIGAGFAFNTYIKNIVFYINYGGFYDVPFFIVSFWLFLLAFFVVLYKYLGLDVPRFLGSLAFIYCFVYGIGSFIFYPLFMGFVRGVTLYHSWNVLAHGFVGLQSILFFYMVKRPRNFQIFILAGLFLLKNFMDLFGNGFLYFVEFNFPLFLKVLLIILVIWLQIIAFYLLVKKKA